MNAECGRTYEIVARAVARAGLRVDSSAIEEVTDRHYGCAVAFCGPFVIRHPVDPYHRERFADEVALLRALAHARLPAAVPEVVWHSEDPPVMIYRRIAGTTAPSPFGGTAARPGRALLFACGYFAGHLHRLRPGRDGMPALPAIEADTVTYVARVFAATNLPDDIHHFGVAALSDWRASSGRTLPPSLVHGDLNWRNIVVNASGSRLAGVIDWPISGVADPHFDFGYVAAWAGDGFAAVAEGYRAASDRALDLCAVDAAVRLRLLATALHAAPAEKPAAFAAARAYRPTVMSREI